MTVNEALTNRADRTAHPADISPLLSLAILSSATVAGVEALRVLSPVKADLVTTAHKCPTSQSHRQKLSAQYGTIPQGAQLPIWWLAESPGSSILPALLCKGLQNYSDSPDLVTWTIQNTALDQETHFKVSEMWQWTHDQSINSCYHILYHLKADVWISFYH